MRRLLLCLLLASPAYADTAPHKEGEYGGVVPGQKDTASKPPKPKRPPAKGTLTWIGFEAKDGGAQLFLQSIAAFDVSQKLSGSTLVVSVNLSKLAANTWRQIDTRFFDNPLSGIVAKGPRRGKGRIEVHIQFKNPKDAREGTLRTATEADGMFYAYLTFPEGTSAEPKKDEPEK